ncbi:MAG: hypothetical protein ORN98_06495 [Alphaproteobacteria bacterium]|nr:hypothetical protein [Alphaproteobacteria bacterium]
MFHPQFQTQPTIHQKTARAVKRPGVDVGDPDGLWKANLVDEVCRDIQDHKSGKSKAISLNEYMAKRGITANDLAGLDD